MIKNAQLEWSDGIPTSTEFSDIYFNKENGAKETEYVFLEGNQLESRWQALNKDHFSIAETGFGTGLNFLCAWDLWLKNSKTHQQLHYLSVERFPLDKDSLIQALSHWPQFKPLCHLLIEHYPPLVDGWHTINIPNPNSDGNGGQIILHLYLGDVHSWLPQIDAEIDAWFLDGFAPSRNPDMWNEQLFLQMARLTPFNGTVATFTAASKIQKLLKAAGFKVSKRKGYGHKREMVMASQQYTTGPQLPTWWGNKPWLVTRHHNHIEKREAVIIGAGIAGSSTAYSLAKRGWQITVIEDQTIASGASGNDQGVLYSKLSAEMNIHSQFYLAGYLFSLRNLMQTLTNTENWQACGVLQLATNEKEEKRQNIFTERHPLPGVLSLVSKQQASDIAGIDIPYSGLFFNEGAWVYPKAWCNALLKHGNITVLENTKAVELIQDTTNSIWDIKLNNGKQLNTQIVIVCNANNAHLIDALSFLPTKPVSGQVTKIANQNVTLKTVLCGDHYVAPSHHGNLNFGASYRIKSDSTNIIQSENTDNINNLISSFPAIESQLSLDEETTGRTSVRCTSPDYTPIVGPICDKAAFMKDFTELKKNKKWKFQKQAEFLTGLYVNIAHGSRGLSSAPLSAEIIASQITGEPLPASKEQIDLINPNRFLVNEIIKR